MKNFKKYRVIFSFSLLLLLISTFSCKDFFDPEQEINITGDELYKDWYEYRSVEMGMYSLQQQLVEQLIVLGELRGDLLTVTPNADADLMEIYNFNVSKTNKYASPTNFFKLISACNNFINILEREHPEVKDQKAEISNYDKLYGEALCMRAWAYFTAVRIYGKVPFISSSLATMEEIEAFVNSPGTYIDSVHVIFSKDGYYNTDTIYNEPIVLEKKLYDTPMIIDYFTNELENNVKAVGVKHDIDRADATWEVTIWNPWAMHALLGQMYLTEGDLQKATYHFEAIVKNPAETERYQLTSTFSRYAWSNIFSEIDKNEHIFTIWFDKNYFQQNQLQNLFLPIPPYKYMLKPTKAAVHKWETTWMRQRIIRNNNPALTKMDPNQMGFPGDPYRGFGTSYIYLRNVGLSYYTPDVEYMLEMKAKHDTRTVNNIMEGMDTVVFKYYTGQYQDDARFILYRAGGIQLYLAEIYTYMIFNDHGTVKTNTGYAKGIVNDGYLYYSVDQNRLQLGVRGRVGLGSGDDQLTLDNIQYIHDPFTNEITGYLDLGSNFLKKQQIFEDQLVDERARELAFEGERFYDLMRVAKRRNDPSFLASRVAEKYPSGKREQVYNFLLDENNWYIHMFD
ncbi:MAG TPA: RagB/SusD family nutrient uptake outer membrane protein [Bacteroidales bacterium]|nr:RagB/SusD family nutrient uptake outer membrane protein [Bacteroidales bacterium]